MALKSNIVGCCLVLLGLGLSLAPEGTTNRWRDLVIDGVRPGRLALRELTSSVGEFIQSIKSQEAQQNHDELKRLRSELDIARSRCEAMSVQLARSAVDRKQNDSLPGPLRDLPKLYTPSLIQATVLGSVIAERWRSGRMLDLGAANGVVESAFVLKGNGAMIDLGDDAEVSPEDALLLGRCVVGKVERVGRWTSTILLLNDVRYRGRARLIHQSDEGFEFGATGVLKGQGKGQPCRLEGISILEKVREGDGVYTEYSESGVTAPLYYGRVTKVLPRTDDKEWVIDVEPSWIPSELTTVSILRTTMDQSRLASPKTQRETEVSINLSENGRRHE